MCTLSCVHVGLLAYLCLCTTVILPPLFPPCPPSRFDTFITQLMSPSIMSLVLAWEPQLKGLFMIYGVNDRDGPADRHLPRQQRVSAFGLADPPAGGPAAAPRFEVDAAGEGDGSLYAMTFVQFLQLCQVGGVGCVWGVHACLHTVFCVVYSCVAGRRGRWGGGTY